MAFNLFEKWMKNFIQKLLIFLVFKKKEILFEQKNTEGAKPKIANFFIANFLYNCKSLGGFPLAWLKGIKNQVELFEGLPRKERQNN